MKDSAPSRELQSLSDWKALGPVGTEGPLLLAHAINDPYLTFCSQKYMAIKLLFLLSCHSCWDSCQPRTGFLSVMLLLGLHSCCLLPFVCLPCDVLGRCRLHRVSWCPLPWCMNANLSCSMVLTPLRGSQLSEILQRLLPGVSLSLVFCFLVPAGSIVVMLDGSVP